MNKEQELLLQQKKQKEFIKIWCDEFLHVDGKEYLKPVDSIDINSVFQIDETLTSEGKSLDDPYRNELLEKIMDAIMSEHFQTIMNMELVEDKNLLGRKNKTVIYDLLKKQLPYLIAELYQIPLKTVLDHEDKINHYLELFADDLGILIYNIYLIIRYATMYGFFEDVLSDFDAQDVTELIEKLGEDSFEALSQKYPMLQFSDKEDLWRHANIQAILKEIIFLALDDQKTDIQKEEYYEQHISTLPFVHQYKEKLLKCSKKIVPYMAHVNELYLHALKTSIETLKENYGVENIESDVVEHITHLKKDTAKRQGYFETLNLQLQYQNPLSHIRIDEELFEKSIINMYDNFDFDIEKFDVSDPYAGHVISFLIGQSRMNKRRKKKLATFASPKKKEVSILNVDKTNELEEFQRENDRVKQQQLDEKRQQVIATLWEAVKTIESVEEIMIILGNNDVLFKIHTLMDAADEELMILEELESQVVSREEYLSIEEEKNELFDTKDLLRECILRYSYQKTI